MVSRYHWKSKIQIIQSIDKICKTCPLLTIIYTKFLLLLLKSLMDLANATIKSWAKIQNKRFISSVNPFTSWVHKWSFSRHLDYTLCLFFGRKMYVRAIATGKQVVSQNQGVYFIRIWHLAHFFMFYISFSKYIALIWEYMCIVYAYACQLIMLSKSTPGNISNFWVIFEIPWCCTIPLTMHTRTFTRKWRWWYTTCFTQDVCVLDHLIR